jgi:hypothetical protein
MKEVDSMTVTFKHDYKVFFANGTILWIDKEKPYEMWGEVAKDGSMYVLVQTSVGTSPILIGYNPEEMTLNREAVMI